LGSVGGVIVPPVPDWVDVPESASESEGLLLPEPLSTLEGAGADPCGWSLQPLIASTIVADKTSCLKSMNIPLYENQSKQEITHIRNVVLIGWTVKSFVISLSKRG
jgi:hypothetical protein